MTIEQIIEEVGIQQAAAFTRGIDVVAIMLGSSQMAELLAQPNIEPDLTGSLRRHMMGLPVYPHDDLNFIGVVTSIAEYKEDQQ